MPLASFSYLGLMPRDINVRAAISRVSFFCSLFSNPTRTDVVKLAPDSSQSREKKKIPQRSNECSWWSITSYENVTRGRRSIARVVSCHLALQSVIAGIEFTGWLVWKREFCCAILWTLHLLIGQYSNPTTYAPQTGVHAVYSDNLKLFVPLKS